VKNNKNKYWICERKYFKQYEKFFKSINIEIIYLAESHTERSDKRFEHIEYSIYSNSSKFRIVHYLIRTLDMTNW